MLQIGEFSRLSRISVCMLRHCDQDHPALRMAGPTREVAHRGPWNAEDPQDYLTEFLVPVQKTA